MNTELSFHTDAALTIPVTLSTINHLVDGSTDPQDFLFYLGSTVSTNKYENNSDPGVDDMFVEITNATSVWVASTAVAANDYARTTAKNGYRYKAQSISGTGVTGASEPTWPTTVGATVLDNEVTWVNDGKIHESTEMKIALSSAGLDTATAGDPVNLGTVINGGSGNAIPVYMRIDDAVAIISSVTELSLSVLNVKVSPI